MKHTLAPLLVLTGCLACAPHAAATSVVCVRTPDALAIAADSLLTARGSVAPEAPRRECKIIPAGGMFFSMTGFIRDPARQYDAARSTAAAIGQGAAIDDAGEKVAATIAMALESELGKLKADAPDLYDRFIRGQKGALLQVLLAGFEGDTPKAVLLGFRQSLSEAGEIAISVERDACPGDCVTQGATLFILGDRRPIEAWLKSGTADWKSPEKAAKLLVEQVIAARTPEVGPPVDVLRIDGKGARWVERKAECPDLSPATNPAGDQPR